MDDDPLSKYLHKKHQIDDFNFIQPKPNSQRAVEFYQKYLYTDRELSPLLKEYNFKSELPSWKWELFAAILVGDRALAKARRGAKGSDLIFHEVKAAQNGNNFEYQYHKNSYREKLLKEKKIKHIFISHWDDFRNLDVRLAAGDVFDQFDNWLPEVIQAYEKAFPEKRFRRSLPYKEIVEKGKIILRIRNGNQIDSCVC